MRNPIILCLIAAFAESAGALPPVRFSGPIHNQVLVQDSPVSAAAADFNGDGKPDLVLAYYSYGGFVKILLGRGDGSFDLGTNLIAGSLPARVAVGDVNSDGKADIAIQNQGSFRLYPGNGDGTFTAKTYLEIVGGAIGLA